MFRVFIDGSAGTTGLRIRERLAGRKDLELILLPEEARKDENARKDAMSRSDVTFFCLPDDAAREAADWAGPEGPVIIDTSTAHRVAPGWVYGLPELKGQREKIAGAKRIANPGCHATGFLALAAPLVAEGVLSPESRLSCFSLTGYSGGGKKMIADYEADGRDPLLDAPRQYGLTQAHKHLPEMAAYAGLTHPPVFSPVVAPYLAGMEVTIPLTDADTPLSPEELTEIYRAYYSSGLIRLAAESAEGGFLSAGALAGRDSLEITVQGNRERKVLISRFDNLGKGASGAAIQNMNLALGLPEDLGLVV